MSGFDQTIVIPPNTVNVCRTLDAMVPSLNLQLAHNASEFCAENRIDQIQVTFQTATRRES